MAGYGLGVGGGGCSPRKQDSRLVRPMPHRDASELAIASSCSRDGVLLSVVLLFSSSSRAHCCKPRPAWRPHSVAEAVS
eukprot:scaffold16963_cov131-Isochrysis_galbana.AAC.2